MKIRVMLVDDHTIFRSGLRAILENQSSIEVVGEAENGWKAIEMVKEYAPHLVIMDIGMAELNGIEATRKIRSESPGVKILALSMHSDKRYVLTMLKAGASGYLLKNCAIKELTRAIDTIMAKQIYLSPSISKMVLDELLLTANGADDKYLGNPDLTPREREVLQLLAEGKSTKQIASQLHISVSTAETHRRQMMEKLDLHSVAELTKFAIREGMTPLE